jgi:hypothetical protein
MMGQAMMGQQPMMGQPNMGGNVTSLKDIIWNNKKI